MEELRKGMAEIATMHAEGWLSDQEAASLKARELAAHRARTDARLQAELHERTSHIHCH